MAKWALPNLMNQDHLIIDISYTQYHQDLAASAAGEPHSSWIGMEVFVAKFDYDKEREDILSFKQGDKFQIASKADKRWWAAYAIDSQEYGYVPSRYLEVSIEAGRCKLVSSLWFTSHLCCWLLCLGRPGKLAIKEQ